MVPRSTTIFLLFGIVLIFGLLLIFTFKVLALGCLIYLLMIPLSGVHFFRLKNNLKNIKNYSEEEPEDVL